MRPRPKADVLKHRRAKIALAVAAGVLVVGFGIVQCGQHAGQQLAAASIAQIQLVWPDVLSFPDKEKLLLAELALECRLSAEPATAAAVLACLERAADAKDSKDNQIQAGAELRRLIRMKGGG